MEINRTCTVTAVIVNHNGGESILACIRSLLEQTVEVSILVVDAGSSDGSADRIREICPDAVILPLSMNPGFAHAANCGLRLVRTPYAFFVRPFVRPAPSAVKVLTAVLEADPGAFAAQALILSSEDRDTVLSAGRGLTLSGRALDLDRGRRISEGLRLKRTPACDYAVLYRLSVLEEIGWFDERHYRYLEEIDLGLRAVLYGLHALSVPQARAFSPGSFFLKAPSEAEEALTNGNSLYLRWKNRCGPVLSPDPLSRLFSGKEEAPGLSRGKALCALSREEDLLRDSGTGGAKKPLSEEALVDTDGRADAVYPLFLGGRIYLSPDMLADRLRIRRLLLAGSLEEARQRQADNTGKRKERHP